MMHRRAHVRAFPLLTAAFAAVALATALAAGALPMAAPAEVGLSPDRLARINAAVQRYIDAGNITGAVTVVARRGRVAHFEAQGLMDRESKTPMRDDAIFRIASMSKPITGVAILMLVEDGKVRLSDPVSRFIPEFKETKVAVARAGAAAVRTSGGRQQEPPIDYVSAVRPITVRDLLTHTSGLASGGLGSREAARMAPRDPKLTLAEHVPKLGAAPLDFQPGTEWRYSALAGIDTLGRIVEVASGLTFDRFLQQRLFAPLGMKDTAFVVPAENRPRVVTLYERPAKGGPLERQDTPAWLNTTTLFSGGGGLYSTAEDYTRFGLMLANGGELNGTRVLGPRTVALMRSNHVGDKYHGVGATLLGMGFGLTVDVVVDSVVAGTGRSTGSFGWGGAFGTSFWVDPKEEIVGVLMVQTPASGLRGDFEWAVMQAIVD